MDAEIVTGTGKTGKKLRILGIGLHTGTRSEDVEIFFGNGCNSRRGWPISVLREVRGTSAAVDTSTKEDDDARNGP